MPVFWGTPTTAPSMDNYLDTQYVKFFEQHSLDFDLLRKAGQWTVVVWVYENIVPIRVNAEATITPSRNSNLVFENGYIVARRRLLVSGEPRSVLEDALLCAYRATKDKLQNITV